MTASKPIRYLRQAALAAGAFLGVSLSAHAQNIPGYPDNIGAYDAREVAMLPRYCIHTHSFRERIPGGNNPEQIEYWRSVMGKTYEAMHHYCWGLMKTNRALVLSRDRRTRLSWLQASLAEFDYVIANAPKDFVLLPEIHTRKGENLILLGRAPLGIQELARAIEAKPDYWPPYVHLSDYYKSTRDLKKARELLEKALSFAPDVKDLQMRLAELNAGKDKRKPSLQPAQKPVAMEPPAGG